MKALIIADGRAAVAELPVPRPRTGFALLRVLLFGLFDPAPLVANEVTAVGSRCGRFEPARALLYARQVEVGDLVSAEFRLSQAIRALSFAARQRVKKVLFRPSPSVPI